jgi:HEAT repeat protein
VLTYYCWHCYGQNRRASGRCDQCGREIATHSGASFDDQLMWALKHPLAERRMLAVHAIAQRRLVRAREQLQALLSDPDAYLAAAALEALVALDGLDSQRVTLERVQESGAAPVRAAARELLSPKAASVAGRRSGG